MTKKGVQDKHTHPVVADVRRCVCVLLVLYVCAWLLLLKHKVNNNNTSRLSPGRRCCPPFPAPPFARLACALAWCDQRGCLALGLACALLCCPVPTHCACDTSEPLSSDLLYNPPFFLLLKSHTCHNWKTLTRATFTPLTLCLCLSLLSRSQHSFRVWLRV